MNRRVLGLAVLLIAIFLTFRFCSSNDKQKVDEKPTPLSVAVHSGAFNQSFSGLLESYYALKDAFVASNTELVNSAADRLIEKAASLQVDELRGDTSGTIRETAKTFVTIMNSSAAAIKSEQDIEEKRREFNMLSDALWNLTRTVQYDGEKVYYQYCPMAFDNSGAYWLSNNKEIRNPYFGSKMLNCGEVTDSLDYSKQ